MMTFCEMNKQAGGCPECPNRYVCKNSTVTNPGCTHNYRHPCNECVHYRADHDGERQVCHNDSDEGYAPNDTKSGNATLTLTEQEATNLRTFLLMTAKYREGEAAACRELGAEIGEDGSLRYPNMKANTEWWSYAIPNIERIIEKMRGL